MDVRPGTVADALAIETIRIRGWRVAYRHIFPPAALDALPVEETRWRQRLAEPPAGWAVFVAEDEGAVTGFAAIGPSRDEPGAGELYAIYVEPSAWRSGAGRALVAQAEATLRARYVEATLWVLEDNPRARRFYESAGWQTDGARKAEERFGVLAAEVRYRKTFRASGRSGRSGIRWPRDNRAGPGRGGRQ
jgi:ribosomal protein S18 acetylase RimI-like enzyme